VQINPNHTVSASGNGSKSSTQSQSAYRPMSSNSSAARGFNFNSVSSKADCVPPLMQLNLDCAIPASGDTSVLPTGSVSNTSKSSHHIPASSVTKSGQCGSAIMIELSDAKDKTDTIDHQFNSVDFCRSARSLEKKNDVNVSSVHSSSSTSSVVEMSLSEHRKFTAAHGKSTPSGSSPCASPCVSLPLFVQDSLDGPKAPLDRKSHHAGVPDMGLESVFKMDRKSSTCVTTVTDSAAVSSSDGSLAESVTSSYSTSPLLSLAAQRSAVVISSPGIGRGRKLKQILENGSAGSSLPKPGGLFLHSLSLHERSC